MKPAREPGQADLRAFRYGLEPYVRTQEWQLDRLQAALGVARRAHEEAVQQQRALQADLMAQAQALGRGFQARQDPAAHRRGLDFLSGLQHRIARHQVQVQLLRRQMVEAQRACALQQRKLDGLHDHRSDAARAFAAEVERKDAAERDRDWLSRSTVVATREGQ